jgi:UDP:flavonoid glycosyltransferase YjiC (YdhE family)
MVVMPLFWDQHDNAQRVDETGFGVRLPTYTFAADELVGAVDRLLDDGALGDRLGQASARLQANPGNERAAELIERVATTGEPVESS